MTDISLIDLLQRRRSTPARLLTDPGPTRAQLESIIQSALRVPDHGKLEPWRILVVSKNARQAMAEWLARRHRQIDPDVAEVALAKDRQRFGETPALLILVSSIESTERIPEQEQLLSAGCVGFSLLLGAEALGFTGQWLTGWAAYDRGVADYLRLQAHERVIGFFHFGSAKESMPERPRPRLQDKLREFEPQ